MPDSVVLSSRVRLARNYDDLPFDSANRVEDADLCVIRTAKALAKSGDDAGFDLLRLRDLSELERRSMVESHIISKDLLKVPDTAAVLVKSDEAVSVMMNEEDHLRIQAICPGMDLLTAAARCFRVDDALSRECTFAFDEQLGYLTSFPTNTGTGMRASLLMHLPMLTLYKQMGNVTQIVAKVGLTIRGVYGEGSEALANIYQISNQVTLGRTEQEIISALTAVGRQLTDMEQALRSKAANDGSVTLQDNIYRAWGLMRHARILALGEFYHHWSYIRLGCAMSMLPLPLDAVDSMLDQVQEAHLRAFSEQPLEGNQLDIERATRVRQLLRTGDDELTKLE